MGGQVGECILYTDSSVPMRPVLFIKQADPVVEIDGQLWKQIEDGRGHPSVLVVGDVLTIRAENQTVVYRVTDYDELRNIYRAEWPD